jgi:ribokinase
MGVSLADVDWTEAYCPAGRDTDGMGSRVVVVGSLNLDLVISLERMPDSGETVFGSTLEQHAGGKGLNQAVAAARLDVPVSMIGALGDDSAATWLGGVVEAERIDGSAIARVEGISGTALIEVDAGGANRIVVIPGANAHVTADHVRTSIAALSDIGIVLTQGEVPTDAVVAAMAAGRAAGACTILNPAPVRDYPDELYAHVDYVIPNEHEAAHLTGLETGTAADATEAARHLVRRGAGCVIVTRGGKGAVWATPDATGSCGAFPIVPVDTVAAGDAFCGGLAAALSEGLSLSEALRWASAAGALAATAAGAVPSLPRREAVEDLVNSGS